MPPCWGWTKIFERDHYLVTMEWNGAKEASLAFVGKGNTVRRYSLKPTSLWRI